MSIKKVNTKVDFIKSEHDVLDFWKENLIFEKRRELNKGKKKLIFIDGPITENNPMGVHHAWGRSLKDIYNRYKSMCGFELRYQNGFDCQGLWVEIEVEKELGFESKRDVEEFGIEKLLLCVKSALINIQKYKRNNQSVLDIGWTGTIHTTPCLMRIIIRYGHFSRNYGQRVRYIVEPMLFLGAEDPEPPIPKWRSLKGVNSLRINLFL